MRCSCERRGRRGVGWGWGGVCVREESSERHGPAPGAVFSLILSFQETHRGRRRVGAQLAQRWARRTLLLLLLLSLLWRFVWVEGRVGSRENSERASREKKANTNGGAPVAPPLSLPPFAHLSSARAHHSGVLAAPKRGHEARVRLLRRHVHRRIKRHGERRHSGPARRVFRSLSLSLFLPVFSTMSRPSQKRVLRGRKGVRGRSIGLACGLQHERLRDRDPLWGAGGWLCGERGGREDRGREGGGFRGGSLSLSLSSSFIQHPLPPSPLPFAPASSIALPKTNNTRRTK